MVTFTIQSVHVRTQKEIPAEPEREQLSLQILDWGPYAIGDEKRCCPLWEEDKGISSLYEAGCQDVAIGQ